MSKDPHGLAPPLAATAEQPPLTEQQAVGQDQRLLAIFELAKILVSEAEQETTLARFLSGLIDWLDAADAGSLWLYDAADDGLVAVSAQGYDMDSLSLHFAV